MSLTSKEYEAFCRDGYVLVEGLFDPAQMAEALADMEHIFYGCSFGEYLNVFDKTGTAASIEPTVKNPVAHYGDTVHGRTQFPTGSSALDSLIENETYLDIIAECLDTDAISYCNAHLFMRSGPSDTRHAEHPWQGYHVDHGTNCYLPVNESPGSYDYLNSMVYLHDVEEEGAPMHVIPGSHRQAGAVLLEVGQSVGGSIPDLRDFSELGTPVSTAASAGSVLLYSSYLIHAAVPFKDKRQQRACWTLSLAREATSRWTKLANPWSGPERQHFQPFWEQATPRVRSIFGWPPPGHDYYTEATFKSLALNYPEMDLSPYRL